MKRENMIGRGNVEDTPELEAYYRKCTKAQRHTGSVLYQVAKGRGHSVIDGERYDWQEKDVFCVPSWSVHEHANASGSEDACLFSFNDFPVMRALALMREEGCAENSGRQPPTGGGGG